ncbi:energy transducer TonB [Bacteroidota bacterium]
MKTKYLLAILIPLLIGCKVFKKNESPKTEEVVEVLTKELIEVNNESSYKPNEEIFVSIEQLPTYVGGEQARIDFINANLKYPELAKEQGIQGTVYVTFIVEKDGSLSEAKIIRGIGGGCDEEAIRIVKLMPNWNPGKLRGNAIRIHLPFNMPIKFTIAD